MQFNTLGSGIFNSIEGCCPVQPALVYVRHDEERRMAVRTMQHIIDHGKSHRSYACQQSHLAILLDLHGMLVRPRMSMIAGVQSANHARKRLTEGRRIKSRASVRQKAASFHHFIRNDDISGIATYIFIGIARGGKNSYRPASIVQGWLDGEFVSGLEPSLPLLTYFNYFSCELVSDNHRVFGYIVRHSLVSRSLVSGLIGRHADAVAHYLGKNLVILHLRKVEFFQT